MNSSPHATTLSQPAEPPQGERAAALLLHGLHPADRQWVLGQLRPVQRAALQTLLDELVALGLPADPELVQAAIGQAPGAPVRATPPPAPIDGSPEALATLLMSEPQALAGMYLGTLETQGAEQVLKRLPAERSAPVRAAMANAPRLATALHESLREAVRLRLHPPPVLGDMAA